MKKKFTINKSFSKFSKFTFRKYCFIVNQKLRTKYIIKNNELLYTKDTKMKSMDVCIFMF